MRGVINHIREDILIDCDLVRMFQEANLIESTLEDTLSDTVELPEGNLSLQGLNDCKHFIKKSLELWSLLHSINTRDWTKLSMKQKHT